MTGARLVWGLAALAAIAFAPRAHAQSPAALVAQGVRAYQNLDFDAAAGLLRRALFVRGREELVGVERAQALVYLSASEIFRRNPDSARAGFRQLVLFNPRHRPDQVVFPPAVLNLFEEVRRETKALAARAPADTTFRRGAPGVAVRLYASSFHEVAVTLQHVDGRPVRALYAGPIGDSLDVPWDGADSTGAAVAPGRYALIAASLAPGGRVARLLRLPLELALVEPDTMLPPPPPPDSLFLSERTSFGPALGALAKGALVGVAVTVLPAALADGEDAMRGRLVVGGAVTLAGVAAFLARGPGRPITANAERNRALRELWRLERDRVARENAALRDSVRLRVRAGPAAMIDPEAP